MNSQDEEHVIYFEGESGTVTLDDEGEIALIEVHDVDLSTCDCCGVPLRSQPYTLHANRLLLYPDQLIAVFGLTARIAGVPTLWLPVYVQPLDDTFDSPLFPAIGNNALRGWFLKWNVPFYLSESLFGTILLDYYAKHDELGVGFDARYEVAGHKGQVRVYNFPAKVGDSVLEVSVRHELPAAGVWSGSGSVDYSVVGGTTELDYGAQAQGSSNGWTVNVSAAREVEERNTDDEDETNDTTKVTERFPEISMSRNPWTVGVLSIQPRFELGQYREQVEDDPSIEASRLSGGLSLSAQLLAWGDISITPRINIQASGYLGDELKQSQSSLRASIGAKLGHLNATYDLQLVQGDSPFDFDAEVATHHIGLSFSRDGWAKLNLSSGFDLSTQTPDPIQANLSWTIWADWSLHADYSLVDATLDAVQLSGNWRSDALRLSLNVPYQPIESRFGTITLSAEMPGERISADSEVKLRDGELTVRTDLESTVTVGPVDLSGNARFMDLALDSLSVSSTFVSEVGWGAKARWTYSGGPISLDQVLYGVFWDIGGCLRVGVDREASDTWLYISILAFPEAILRYAPESARVQAGN